MSNGGFNHESTVYYYIDLNNGGYNHESAEYYYHEADKSLKAVSQLLNKTENEILDYIDNTTLYKDNIYTYLLSSMADDSIFDNISDSLSLPSVQGFDDSDNIAYKDIDSKTYNVIHDSGY